MDNCVLMEQHVYPRTVCTIKPHLSVLVKCCVLLSPIDIILNTGLTSTFATHQRVSTFLFGQTVHILYHAMTWGIYFIVKIKQMCANE
jgi:hypothetical protein